MSIRRFPNQLAPCPFKVSKKWTIWPRIPLFLCCRTRSAIRISAVLRLKSRTESPWAPFSSTSPVFAYPLLKTRQIMAVLVVHTSPPANWKPNSPSPTSENAKKCTPPNSSALKNWTMDVRVGVSLPALIQILEINNRLKSTCSK